ncbi:MAG: GAF domain-containing protein [Myxococcota bacterium]
MKPAQRVLVLDEDRATRESIRDALAEAGIGSELATTASEAQKAIEDPRVACVVLDVRAGAQDALGLLAWLQEQQPSLRIIALAGHVDQDLVLEALRRGACDYLAKPIHPEELRLAIERAFEGQALSAGWDSLRHRLARLAEHVEGLERSAREEDEDALLRRLVLAAGDVLDAQRVSVLRLVPEGRLRVVASEGLPAPEHDLDEALVDESVAGLALREGYALAIENIESDARCVGRGQRPHYGSASVALAPLLGDSGALGVLCATDRADGGVFGEEDVCLLRLLAQAAQGAWARFHAAPSEAVPSGEDPHLELVREICDGITRELDPERVLQAALRPVARIASARVASLYLVDARGRLARQAQCEVSDGDHPELPIDTGLTASCLHSGSLVATDHPDRDSRFDARTDAPESGVAGPLLIVPLRVRERVLGIARIHAAPEAGASSRLGELVAGPLSAAVRNVLLYRSLLDSVEDVARARREAEERRTP